MPIREYFKLNQLPAYLRENEKNTIEFFNTRGILTARTFSEVYQDSVNAMKKLDNLVLKKGNTVVIMGKTSYYWLAAEAACIFAGIRIVAMPENFSSEQVIECLGRYEIDAVLADRDLHNIFSPMNMPVLALDESLTESANEGEDPEITYENISKQAEFSIIVFTSGTTSKIKSFAIKAQATERMIRGYIEVFHIDSDDRWLICHPFSHYSHLEYALGGLCAGYNLILTDMVQALAYFRRFRPSIFVSVPVSYYHFYEQLRQVMGRLEPEQKTRIEVYQRINPFLDRPKLNQAFGRSICKPIHDFFGGNMKFFIIGTAPSKQEVRDFFIRSGLPLYEGYGLTETGMIATNSLSAFRKGSVGRVFPGISLEIQEDGVIRSIAEVTRVTGYDNFSLVENKETFTGDNQVITGDIGYLDEDGFLYVEGRKIEMIITNGGKKINPVKVEGMLLGTEAISQCIVVGNNYPYLIAVLVVSEGTDSKVIERQLEEVNSRLAEHERIKDFIITTEPFSEENQLLTRSKKIIRKAVEERFAAEIEECYRVG